MISSKQTLIESNGFLVPQWGGILIRNVQGDHHFNLEEVGGLMSYYVAQLRILLGITPSRIKHQSKLIVF